MAKYETISVKVPADLKEKITHYGVKTGEVVRNALQAEVKRRQLEEIEKQLEPLRTSLNKINPENVVTSIREDRDRR